MQNESPRFSHEGSSGSNDDTCPLPAVKERFPFRVATTSYIIPAAILPNLHFLGPYVEEVELVLFESKGQENLPSSDEIREMQSLASIHGFTYNVHLPSDVFLGDPDRTMREEFRQTILRFYEKTLPLVPSAYILHLDSRNADGTKELDREIWTQRVWESIELLVREGLDPRRVVVENLEYPLEWVRPVVEAMEMEFCLDIGHLLRYGYDLKIEMAAYLARSPMVHLHGVRNGVDHLGIHWIPQGEWNLIRQALTDYTGTLSIEVFSLEDLRHSLYRLLEEFKETKRDETRDNLTAD